MQILNPFRMGLEQNLRAAFQPRVVVDCRVMQLEIGAGRPVKDQNTLFEESFEFLAGHGSCWICFRASMAISRTAESGSERAADSAGMAFVARGPKEPSAAAAARR